MASAQVLGLKGGTAHNSVSRFIHLWVGVYAYYTGLFQGMSGWIHAKRAEQSGPWWHGVTSACGCVLVAEVADKEGQLSCPWRSEATVGGPGAACRRVMG